jgi:hypothetical protein
MGGGFTHLIMPVIFDGIKMSTPAFQAWRWAFFVPGAFQIILMAATLLLAQDMPGGNFAELKKSGAMKQPKGVGVWKAAVFNYRWGCEEGVWGGRHLCCSTLAHLIVHAPAAHIRTSCSHCNLQVPTAMLCNLQIKLPS